MTEIASAGPDKVNWRPITKMSGSRTCAIALLELNESIRSESQRFDLMLVAERPESARLAVHRGDSESRQSTHVGRPDRACRMTATVLGDYGRPTVALSKCPRHSPPAPPPAPPAHPSRTSGCGPSGLVFASAGLVRGFLADEGFSSPTPISYCVLKTPQGFCGSWALSSAARDRCPQVGSWHASLFTLR